MHIILTIRRTLSRVFLLAAIGGMTWSCVNHAYDFDRTDRNFSLWSETITIPLGDTPDITVQSLLGEKLGDKLVTGSDGTCSIQYKGNPFSFVFDELRDFDGKAPFERFCDVPIIYDFPFFDKPATPKFDAKGEADLTGLIPSQIKFKDISRSASLSISNIPKELTGLKSISLSSSSRFELTITIPDCMFIDGTVTPDVTVDVGQVFEGKEFPDGIIRFDTPLTKSNDYTVNKTFHLNKIVFDPKSFDAASHTLTLKATVKFSGNCTISGPRTNRSLFEQAPDEIQFQTFVTLYDVTCEEVEGSFSYSRKEKMTFPLGDLTGGMTDGLDGDIYLDFTDPAILLDIDSNIPIPVSAKLDLAARKNKVTYAEVKGIPIDFPYSTSGSTTSKHIRMSKDGAAEPGVDPIQVDFSGLLSHIPDDMQITVAASTRSTQNVVLRFGQTYKVKTVPQIIIPLSFGPALKMEVRDTLAMPERLGTLLKNNTLQLVGEMTNALPLQLAFSLVMTDDNGNPLTEPVHQVIEADSTCDLSLTLVKKTGADPAKLSSAILTFEVNGIPQGRPVKIDDAIRASLRILIPGGYHTTL